MVPTHYSFLQELPLTSHGKVNRKALPVPDLTRTELKGSFIAPRTSAEKTLVGIWREVLGLKQVGVHDNFFELGGHSLKATQVISRVRETFQVEMPLRTLFDKPTVEKLAVTVTKMQAERVAPVDMSHILTKIESLPDEKAQRHLLDGSKSNN